MHFHFRMQVAVTPAPSWTDPDLWCGNPTKPRHILKNPVTVPCCPGTRWCRACAGLTILQNGKRCYAGCGRSVQQRDLTSCGRPVAEPDTTKYDSDTNATDSSSEDSDDSIHTLGNASDAADQDVDYATDFHEEDTTQRLIFTPTNYGDPTPFPTKRSIRLNGNLRIHALVSEVDHDVEEIYRCRIGNKWEPQAIHSGMSDVRIRVETTDTRDNRETNTPRTEAPFRAPISAAELIFRAEDAEYFARTGDSKRDCRGHPIPLIWFTDWDERGAYLTADEPVPGVSPVLMGIRDKTGEIWWQTTDRITNNIHQVWLGRHVPPESTGIELLAEYARKHWPREDLINPPHGSSRVRLVVARGSPRHGEGPSITTTDTSEADQDEDDLSMMQTRRRRRLVRQKRRAREQRRRRRHGTPIEEWLARRFPNPSRQTGPIVTPYQPLHKSRVWLKDIEAVERLHRSFQSRYPSKLKDWLIMGRSPDPTAVNNVYTECEFEKWRWTHHVDDRGRTWLAGYQHRTGPRQGRLRKSYRTLKVLTVMEDHQITKDPIELRDHRIAALQEVAHDETINPIMVCSSAYREQDHFDILEGLGWPEWSEVKRKSYRACYNWRCRTKVDQDMEPMGPFRSWPEVISFINGFLGGYYETEVEALQQIKGFRPEEEEPRPWWPYIFPQECRRAKRHMADIATRTLDSLRKDTENRTAAAKAIPERDNGAGQEGRNQAWWWTRRRNFVKPTPPHRSHTPGIWKRWAVTPYPNMWDGWTRHEERRPQINFHLHPEL